MMSSVSKVGVAESSRLNERSAITIATPIAGKSFTRRPSQVNQRRIRFARFGSASVPLARGIAKEVRAGFVDVALEKHPGGFPDGERYVRLLGAVAGEHVVLVQTTHPDPMIVELLLLADAIRDAGARRITAVVPYFGYGRQDKRFLDGEPISAKTIARHIAVD